MSGSVDGRISEIGEQTICEFVYREARLIDSREFEQWFNLYTDDAIYWMPLARGQGEEDIYNALFFEDKLMLQVRIERLAHPRAFSQAPPSYCQHVLQAPRICEELANGDVLTETPFIYVESQAEDQFMLAGVAHHQLRVTEGALGIFRKRIELLNRDAALPSIQLFL